MMLFKNDKQFYYEYELPLAQAFYEIDSRGVLMDINKLATLRKHIEDLTQSELDAISIAVGKKAIARAEHAGGDDCFNVNSNLQLQRMLASDKFGVKLPTKFNYKTKRSNTTANEDALLEAFAKTQLPILQHVLRIRELSALAKFTKVRLADGIFYTTYSVAGTVSGRRSARKSFCGLGGNGQNQPKHGDLAKKLRECFIARPGNIFVSFDQVSAEDWAVTAIIADVSGVTRCFEELKSGIDRHAKLASRLFSKPLTECGKDASGSDTPERFMGKKTRHAGHYGEQEVTMSKDMAKHGFSLPPIICATLLRMFHEAEPEIQGVFQRYVTEQVFKNHELFTPAGRHRQFFGIRPWRGPDDSSNAKIIREAFSYIPQSTVGDNTGLAILEMERAKLFTIMDVHDATAVECEDRPEQILRTCETIAAAFDRTFVMPNGFAFKIPIEGQIGYDLKNMKELGKSQTITLEKITQTLNNLRSEKTKRESATKAEAPIAPQAPA
jgi:DNA polymerase-1